MYAYIIQGKPLLGALTVFVLLSSAVFCFANPAPTKNPQTTIWPRLDGNINDPNCAAAFSIARAAFLSSSERLFLAASDIQKNNPGIILAPPQEVRLDDFLKNPHWNTEVTDPNSIEITEEKETDRYSYPGTLYIQKNPLSTWRIAIEKKPFRDAYTYSFYLMNSTIEINKIEDLLSAPQQNKMELKEIPIDAGYNGMWLVQNAITKNILIIAKNPTYPEPWDDFADWIIYLPDNKDSANSICRIHFKPNVDSNHTRELLPKPLYSLAILLYQILGTPEQEGTYHAIDRVRGKADTAWKNLLFRPWALQDAYNPPEQIDQELKLHAKYSAGYRKQYQQFKKLRAEALPVLAKYYQTTLHQSKQDAEILAKTSLDRAIGAHFLLHKERPKPST